ncbi:Holliday junction resolvase-like protein [Candidatus Pyrohabitans sp.]
MNTVALLAGIAAVEFLLLLHYRRAARRELSMRQSIASRHGRIYEQFLPFLKEYPYSAENFRFLGSPVDGVQFEDDRIIFIEFKSANSRLSKGQSRIKEIINSKRVYFKEIRLR